MRIAYVTSQFPVPSETFACSDVLQLQKLGHEVFVYGFRPEHGASRQMVEERGLQNVHFKNSNMRRYALGLWSIIKRSKLFFQCVIWLLNHQSHRPLTLFKALFLLPLFFTILDDICEINPKVIHLFWGNYPSILGFLVKRVLPQAVLSIFLGAHDLETNLRISAEVARTADCVFTHSRANLDYFARIGVASERLCVVHRGLDVDSIRSKIQGRSKIKGKILSAGRLIEQKGFDNVIRAFSNLVLSNPEVQLVILGDGPERAALQDLARSLGLDDKVCFLGHVSHDDVLMHMAEAEVFMLMSRYESERLPNVIKEAMLCGCVCITTKTPGIDELVFHGKTGYLVEYSDFVMAARFAAQILDSPMISIREESLIFVAHNFDLANSMRSYVGCWQRIIEKRKSLNLAGV